MPLDEDIRLFFSPADFAEPVTVGGAPLNAIFDADFGAALGVAGTGPQLTCSSVDVVAVQTGAAVTVRAQPYTVVGIEPDGTGITVLRLQAA